MKLFVLKIVYLILLLLAFFWIVPPLVSSNIWLVFFIGIGSCVVALFGFWALLEHIIKSGQQLFAKRNQPPQ